MLRRSISASLFEFLAVFLALEAFMLLPHARAQARWNGPAARSLDTKIFYQGLSRGSPLRADSLVPSPSPGSPDSGINQGRLAIVGGTLLGSIVAIPLYQHSRSVKDNRAP